MNISWDLIRTFEWVAKTGSLSAASRALDLSQPTVGRHIDLLEDALNLPLFIRSREGMKLTDEGANLVAAASEMVRSADGFERQASGLDKEITGIVRISANEIFGVLILPRLLPDFMDANPGIEIELIVSNSAADLLGRDADVALRMFRPVQNDLVARKITELPLGFYAHRDYLTKHDPLVKFADLRDHRLIGFDRETSQIEAAKMLGEQITASDFAFRCDNILTHIEAIRSGLGIGVMHQGLAPELDRVDRVLEDVPLPNLGLWVVCHSEVRYNRRIRLLMDFLADRLRKPYESGFVP